MVYAISKDNRGWFPRELDTMYRDRKRVFVDRLKWNVPVVDGIHERDQFDGDDAVYIVVADGLTGQHQGSLRLIPSTAPHMLRDVFSVLCPDGVPAGPHIWEMTRICLSPSLPREAARKSLGLVWLGAVEFGLDRGIEIMTGLTHAPMFSNILAAGIDIEPLGPVTEFDGVQYAALQTRIDETVLLRERARLNERHKVLAYAPPAAAAA
ncbi:MAG: autoinducer synthase [Alphaproteobacteria bacterium]|nr:autoinducer synthase [Alphaproteobacteria bacterium]MBV9064100.1 autoinducer synthase [Alphaproteobacteria bacterium]